MTTTLLIRDITRQPFCTRVLEIDAISTIGDLKTLLFDKSGIPKALQSLTFGTNHLCDDNKSLYESGLTDFSSVILNTKFTMTNKDSSTQESNKLNFSDPIKMTNNTFNQFFTNLNNKNYSVIKTSTLPLIYSVNNILSDTSFKIIITEEDNNTNLEKNKEKSNAFNFLHSSSMNTLDTKYDDDDEEYDDSEEEIETMNCN